MSEILACTTLVARFWPKVDIQGPDDCWLWTAAKLPTGYGRIGLENGKSAYAHRVAYELTYGQIPIGLELDHTCHNPLVCTEKPCIHRACCNPSHLEAVTHKENCRRGGGFGGDNARKTHCPKGHPLSGKNLMVDGTQRKCRTCRNEKKRAAYWADPDKARASKRASMARLR